MIEEAFLVSTTDKGREARYLELWPSSVSTEKVGEVFKYRQHYIEITFEEQVKVRSAYVLLNGFEIINLSRFDGLPDSKNYFRSENLTKEIKKSGEWFNQKFFDGALGVYELKLVLNGQIFDLRTFFFNFEKRQVQRAVLKMYKHVAESELFELFTSDYQRSNASSDMSDQLPASRNPASHAKQAKKVVEAIHGLGDFQSWIMSRVTTVSTIAPAHRRMAVGAEGINWLLTNPSELMRDPEGVILHKDVRYSSQRALQTDNRLTRETPENELVISCLRSISLKLGKLLKNSAHARHLYQESIQSIVGHADTQSKRLSELCGKTTATNVVPSYMPRFFNDGRLGPLFSEITAWYRLQERRLGNSEYWSTPSVTEVFEQYAAIRLVEALKLAGFTEATVSLGDHWSILLNRGDDSVQIDWEPNIGLDTFPVFCSKPGGLLTPDFLIHAKFSDGREITGIVDAKFSIDKKDLRNRASEVWSKYGMYCHKQHSNEPLDFVFAVGPSTDSPKLQFTDGRNSQTADLVLPRLGFFKVPLSMGWNESESSALISLLTTPPSSPTTLI